MDADAEAREVADQVGHRRPVVLGGQRHRVVVALARDGPRAGQPGLDGGGDAGQVQVYLVLSLRSRGVAVLLNSHLIGEVERVCDRVVVLDSGRVAAAGTLAELLGRRELRLRLTGVGPAAEARLARTGAVSRRGQEFTVALPDDDDGTAVPALVADLVALGVQVHAVEPARISLEEKLLSVLRHQEDRS